MSSSTINGLLDFLKNLYENVNDDADTTFLVHVVEVKAHKAIIGDRCEVLKAMFLQHGLTDSEGRYVIADKKISVENFKSFLKWLYLDDCEVSFDNLAAMFHIAHIYMLPSLKKKCLKFVFDACLEHHEIIRCCELALEVEDECPEMIRHCFELISKTRNGLFLYIISTARKNRASPALVERLAKEYPRGRAMYPQKTFSDERYIFKVIVGWAVQECRKRNLVNDPFGMHTVLAPIVKHMKLDDIPFQDWIDNVYSPINFVI